MIFQNRILMRRRSRLAIAADAGYSRRRAGPKRCETGRCFGGINRLDIVSKGAAGNQSGEVGKFPLAEHFVHE